jgi:D-serine deaminase-like pyridoxal phosphate-dependent protein
VLEGLENARGVLHNEEHLVVEADSTEGWVVGKPTLAWPVHACPTSAWYDEAIAIDASGNIAGIWPIDARGRGSRIIELLA